MKWHQTALGEGTYIYISNTGTWLLIRSWQHLCSPRLPKPWHVYTSTVLCKIRHLRRSDFHVLFQAVCIPSQLNLKMLFIWKFVHLYCHTAPFSWFPECQLITPPLSLLPLSVITCTVCKGSSVISRIVLIYIFVCFCSQKMEVI